MSVDDDDFWARVHERLDAREDTLADPAIVEAIAARPERAEALASMLHALDAVRLAPAEMRSGAALSGARRWVAAAGVLVVLAAGYFATRRPAVAPPNRAEARAVIRHFSPGTTPVASWTVSVERREGATTTQDSSGSDGLILSGVRSSRHDSDSARVAFQRSTRLP